MKRIYILLFIAANLIYGEPVKSGCRFLLMDYDAAAYGIGGGNYTYFYRPTFVLQNPAIGFLVRNPSIYTFYSRKTIGANILRFQLFSPLKSLSLSFDFYGEIFDAEDITDEEGKIREKFITSSFALHPGISTKIYKNLYSGVGLKLIIEDLGVATGTGLSSDFGLLYKIGKTGISIGSAIKDIGVGPKFLEERTPLPSRFGMGLSYSPKDKGNLIIFSSFDKYLKDDLSKIKFGVEYTFYHVLTFRGGINNTIVDYDSATVNITNGGVGFGITAGKMKIDFSFIKNNNAEGLINLSLLYTIIPSEKTSVIVEEGISEKEKMTSMNFYNNALLRASRGDYEGAVELLDIALIWDPDNIEAAEKIGEFKAKMKVNEVSYLVEKGKSFYQKGNYLDALFNFEKAAEIDPSNEEVNKYIILARTGLEQSFKKDTVLTRLIEEGNSFYINGDYGSAIEKWEEALKEGADTTLINGYMENLVERLSSYITEESKKIESLMDGDRLSIASSRLHKLESKLNKIKKIPDLPSQISVIVKEGHKTIKRLRDKLNSKLSSLNNLGISYFKKGEYRKAEGYFRRVLMVDSTNSTAKTYINKITQKKKTSEKDISDIYMKGVLAYTSGNYKLAIYYWNEVLKINPDHKNAKKNIKRAQEKLRSIEGNQ